jgi:Cdc6-like AAA superfamily ATPase
MGLIKTGFFAYGSSPSHSGEFIEIAIKDINYSGHLVSIESWKRLKTSGNLIITDILKKISECDFFCADLTGLNDNVLFETGFAIGKRQPIWLINDTSITSSTNRYKELNLLTTIGYTPYKSSKDIFSKFFEESVYEKNNDLVESIFATVDRKKTDSILLYLKAQHTTNYSNIIIDKIDEYSLPKTVDDPEEVKVQPLSWYLENLLSIPTILVEYSSTNRSGYELHNSKCALISGIALGLGLKTQMIAEEYYETPLDYRELLKKFHNSETCKKAVDPFLQGIRNQLAKIILEQKTDTVPLKNRSLLQEINFGDYVAEHESSNLYSYYVNAFHEHNLIKSEHNIVVGRKGSGKTATLYYLNEKLSQNVKNQVCLIKPVNFEINGVIALISSLKDDFEKGYLTESIWKYLIYSEIAKVTYNSIKDKPIYALSNNDEAIIQFVESNKSIILTDFSTRLEQELENLQALKNAHNQSDFRLRTSEVLHENVIKQLRQLIINQFGKKQRLVVLIDNLDKSWEKGSNIGVIGRFLLGLLSVVGRISRELKGKESNPNLFDFNLVVFIRSDIFKYVIRLAREPDKIEYTKLVWNDIEVFLRIINERILVLNEGVITPDVFWKELIVNSVNGQKIDEFIATNIIPRPRDIIFFFDTLKNIAISRGHSKIQEHDILKGYEEYSNWVFKSLIVENGITMDQMHNFLYNLLGENVIIQKERIMELMKASDINLETVDIEYFLEKLVSLSLLGREIRKDVFEFANDFEADDKNKILAKKYGSNRFKIHNAFVPYLECLN